MNRNRSPRTYLLLVMLAALSLLAAACGGGDDGGSENGGDDGGGGETQSFAVRAADFAFEPSELEVQPGAEVSVSFENTGEAPHTMTAEDVGLNIEADAGATADGTFTAPESGSVEFQCTIHPQMTGSIVVAGSSDAGGSGSSDDKEKSDDPGSDDSNYNY